MRRLKICQLITELQPAGAERSVYELARRLDRSRFDVRVVALRGGEVANWLARDGIDVSVLSVRGWWDVLKLRRLAVMLRRQRVDILHTHLFHADLAGRLAASLAGVRNIVHTVHTAEGRFRPWQYAFARFFSSRCRKIICVSDSVYRHHSRRSGLAGGYYHVISNGVDAVRFAHDEQLRIELRCKWAISPDKPLAAFVGRLAPEKGVETLVGAMCHLAARGNPVDLVVAGDGPRRRFVKNFIDHGEGGSRCRLLGDVGDVRGVLSAADMLVMPSRWEGFGLAAAEAMAASLPVVASDVAGLRDVVLPHRTGLLVPCGDVVALAEAVERLAGDKALRDRLGRAGRQRVIEHFGIDATIAAHEQLYLRIAGQSA